MVLIENLVDEVHSRERKAVSAATSVGLEMDRRSWLWRRKSSEKSPGETESSGSISSHSERFSDEQACPTHSSQSPEVTSKAVIIDEDVNDSVKTLKEKLSAALMNISVKEDLVKQHAKVAEEAVSGWEKAEKEVLALKQQLDTAHKKNSALEDRVGHLDGALKECVRQLRQAREEQDQRINEAVAKKSSEWETLRSELENQLLELRSQLQTAKTEATASDPDLRPRLEALEKENSALELVLLSRAEEIELRIIERDLSTQAAEAASKQHLESIKKLAKVEAECRRLKAVARKASPVNDQKSFTASSMCVESYTDSQSENGERLLAVETDMRKITGLEMNEFETRRSDSWPSALIAELDQFRIEKAIGRNSVTTSGEINLMDDFLEMERLAALPDIDSGSSFHEGGRVTDHSNDGQNLLKAEIQTLIHRTAELEEKLEKIEAEKLELQMAFTESQKQLERSQNQLMEVERKWAELQTQLAFSNTSKQAAEEELKAANRKREVAESRLREVELKIKTLLSRVASLEEELQKEHALSAENIAKCKKEVKTANIKREAAESKLREVEPEMITLLSKVASLEVEIEKEHALSAENIARQKEEVKAANLKREETELKFREVKLETKTLLSKIASLEEEVEKERALSTENIARSTEEVKTSNMKREVAESRLVEVELETKTLRSKLTSLEEEIEKEHALSAEHIAKCKALEDEFSKMKHEADLQCDAELQCAGSINEMLKIKQEKELALAASKFAECQKTIASLGQQLKSLATLDDFLIDSDMPFELMDGGVQQPGNSEEKWKLHYTDLTSKSTKLVGDYLT